MQNITLSLFDADYTPNGHNLQWEIFKFHHNIKSGVRVKLPSNKELFVSQTCIYNLLQAESHLLCTTRQKMLSGSPLPGQSYDNLSFDFTDIPSVYQYTDRDVIDLFFMLSLENIKTYNYSDLYPLNHAVPLNHNEYSLQGYLYLVSYVVPSLLVDIFTGIYNSHVSDILLQSHSLTPKKIQHISLLFHIVAIGKNLLCVNREILSKLSQIVHRFPHTLYEFKDDILTIFGDTNPSIVVPDILLMLREDNLDGLLAYQNDKSKIKLQIPLLNIDDAYRKDERDFYQFGPGLSHLVPRFDTENMSKFNIFDALSSDDES